MAEENRGQPREPDQPQRGPVRPGQGAGRSQGVPARPGQGASPSQRGAAGPGQGAGRSQGVPARPRQGASRSQGVPARPRQGVSPSQRGAAGPGQGVSPSQRGAAGLGQGASRSQGVPARPGQGVSPSQRSAARPGQGASRSQSVLAGPGQGVSRSQRGAAGTGQGAGRSQRDADRVLRETDRARREADRARWEADRSRRRPDRSENGQERRSRPKKPAKRQRSIKARVAGALLYALLVIGASVALATLGWAWSCDLLGLNKEFASIEITITDDTRMDSIVEVLEENGLIEYKFLFKLYARFSHAEDKIAAGTYVLNTEMDYHALVSNMSSSSATRQTTNVTIPEGYNIDQIFSLLEERGVSTVEKLRNMAANWDYAFDWLRDIPLGDYHRLEGYLFPDTYTFEMGGNPKYVINKMLVNFDAKMDEYMARYEGEEARYSLHDIVVIASMIEKETDGTVNDERNDYRNISSVIYNRLENPGAETAGYLQLDATLVYINGGRIPSEEDKSINSPYNTYLHQGLPAGPISNPGMTSLLAAMEPADTGYYYYVPNPATGQHEYSRTYAEHQALYARYYGNG